MWNEVIHVQVLCAVDRTESHGMTVIDRTPRPQRKGCECRELWEGRRSSQGRFAGVAASELEDECFKDPGLRMLK